MSKSFVIYRSSAGSGKTRTLAKEYLSLALRFKAHYFKHILAVTFTNKATQEMKDRILDYLQEFATGTPNELANELKAELQLDDFAFSANAQDVLSSILHGYSQFSISTIDAFFQKVIRSFTREAGLAGDYRLEITQDEVLEEVVDNLIDELGNNQQLTDWVVRFATENLENEKQWDVRQSLIEFAREIFREDYKHIEEEVSIKTAEPDYFNNLLEKLRKQRQEFVAVVEGKAGDAMKLFAQYGLSDRDFKWGASGVMNVFRKLSKITSLNDDFKKTVEGKRISSDYQSSKNWGHKDSSHFKLINQLAEEKLIAVLNEIVAYGEKNLRAALSAEVALAGFYSFGLIADISRKLRDYKNENNLMLLADAPKFLNGVIQDSDTPFIYEKVGSFYRHYLIDEFQDTSGLQWKNFYPLLVNGLDQGYKSLVVGDVKQAIYRWRGGDLKLLQEEVENQIGSNRIETNVLASNYRSSAAVVYFNNALFSTTSSIVASDTGFTFSEEVYRDVSQKVARTHEGFVQVQFFLDSKEENWREAAMQNIPSLLERLQDAGVALKDIALLVRRREEGQEIVRYLMDFKNSDKAKSGYRYDVVSNESLRVDGAASVRLITGAMRYLLNPDDDIARAEVAYEYFRIHKPVRTFTEVFSVTNQTVFDALLPPAFGRQKMALKKLPLYELTEALIRIFELQEQAGEFAYIQAFQDAVLKFATRERNDLESFLEFWNDKRDETVIKVPDDVDGAQILTIHKSKGLQFKYVIVPFCWWNMDHEFGKNPILWAKASTPPFDQAGYLPVKYSSKLEETYFADSYVVEHTRSYLDNLNLLYVALTRAEAGLLVMAPYKERSSRDPGKEIGSTASQLLMEGILQNENLRMGWDDATKTYRVGTLVAPVEKPKPMIDAIRLTRFPSYAWSEKLVIRQSSKEFFMGADDQRSKINYGIHLHSILSRIRYAQELPFVFDTLTSEGIITEADRAPLQKQVDELLQNPEVAAWFSQDWDVRTEVPILLPGGVESRIDRLMIKDRKAVVVDFKTGEPSKADQKQVLEYIDTLRKMNFADVDGYVLYVRTGELVSVVQKKVKTIKKKDDNQLGLGL